MKKSKTWILRDYTHITETIINFGSYTVFPISQEAQDVLDELEKITDLHFVFTEKAAEKIDPQKFSELYQAASYSVNPDDSEISGVFEEIRYDMNLYKGQHMYYFLGHGYMLDKIKPKTVGKILEATEILKRSIFKTMRYDNEILYSFYKDPQVWWKKVDRSNTYTTHTVDTDENLVVLRPALYDAIIELINKKPGYQESFCGLWDFIGSVTMKLKTPDLVLDQNPDNVKISTVGK